MNIIIITIIINVDYQISHVRYTAQKGTRPINAVFRAARAKPATSSNFLRLHFCNSPSSSYSLYTPIMVRPHSSILRGALRTIQSRPATGIPQQRLFAASARCRANEKQQASFKSQLYESTQQRLKRERAEQERFAQYQTQSSGGRYAAMMFGMVTNSMFSGSTADFSQLSPPNANVLCHTL